MPVAHTQCTLKEGSLGTEPKLELGNSLPLHLFWHIPSSTFVGGAMQSDGWLLVNLDIVNETLAVTVNDYQHIKDMPLDSGFMFEPSKNLP